MFSTHLKVELINNKGKKWKVLEDLTYHSDYGMITVPKDFQTDFASVPRIPVVFELVGDRGHAAATVHDWLYQHGDLSRKQADLVLRQALRDTNVGKARSYVMYYGVRAFGWLFFKK